jgi:hypothetical protein
MAADYARQRVFANRQHESLWEASGRTAAERHAEMPDEAVQARGAPPGSSGDLDRQRLGEGLPRAAGRDASKSTQLQM